MMKAGVSVNSERRIEQSVVLPRPFSAKINVKRRNVTSPAAPQFLNRPMFLIDMILCRIGQKTFYRPRRPIIVANQTLLDSDLDR